MTKALTILLLLAMTGCATRQPWERSRPARCVELANRAVRNTLEADMLTLPKYQRPVGTISYRDQVTGQAHTVVWIIVDGKTLIYDPSFRKYRSLREIQNVLNVTDGPSAWPWAHQSVFGVDVEGLLKQVNERE